MSNYSYSFFIPQIGTFFLQSEEEHITHVSIQVGEKAKVYGKGCAPCPLLDQAASELEAYCQGQLVTFTVPIKPSGTSFQKKVWSSLLSIPYGTTISYGKVALSIGCPNGARAVGNANNKNPIAVIIPCHRVVGANGSLVGYAYGLTLKEKLLALELSKKISQ